MTQGEDIQETQNTNQVSVETHTSNLTSKDLFIRLTGIEPLPANDKQSKLAQEMSKQATEMLKPWELQGLVSASEVEDSCKVWENAIFLDNSGMQKWAEYHSKIFRVAVDQLSAMDKDGNNVEIQDLLKKAKSLIESINRTSNQAGAITYKPNPLQLEESSVGKDESRTLIVINVDKFNDTNPALVAATSREETGHLVSKLSQYPEVNRKWLEEMMARVVGWDESQNPQLTEDAQHNEAKGILRFDEYKELFDVISSKTGDGGEILKRMFFGREPLNSPLIEKVREAVENVDIIGQFVDAGVSIDDLLGK